MNTKVYTHTHKTLQMLIDIQFTSNLNHLNVTKNNKEDSFVKFARTYEYYVILCKIYCKCCKVPYTLF